MDFIIKGKPISLTVLDFGLFKVNSDNRIIGISGFLIKTDRNELILIDGGFPQSYTKDHVQASNRDRLDKFGTVLRCGTENSVSAQLAKCGYSLDDLTILILTHSHIDHIGALNSALQAPLLIAAAERQQIRPLYWGDSRPLEWPDRNYIMIDADIHLGPLFEVLLASGHTPGQLAVLITLDETGPILITSDAISRPSEIEELFIDSMNPEASRLSAERIIALAASKNAFVIYGHDPKQWPKLRKAPDCYR